MVTALILTKSAFYAAEAAVLLNLSVQQVYRLVHGKKLRAYKDYGGRSWKIPADSIVEYMRNWQEVGVSQKIVNINKKERNYV